MWNTRRRCDIGDGSKRVSIIGTRHLKKSVIVDAIVIEYQDAAKQGTHGERTRRMYDTTSSVGSTMTSVRRSDPAEFILQTGEILDADIVILTDGWIRHFNLQLRRLDAQVGDGREPPPEELAWLGQPSQLGSA